MRASLLQRGKPLILVVEDDPPQLRLLKEILERAGFGVLTATNAAEALESFKHTAVTLVIADHILGGKTGSELAAEIKALTPAMPIVLHSAHPPEVLSHIDVFIRKGEPVRDFLAIIRDVVARFTA